MSRMPYLQKIPSSESTLEDFIIDEINTQWVNLPAGEMIDMVVGGLSEYLRGNQFDCEATKLIGTGHSMIEALRAGRTTENDLTDIGRAYLYHREKIKIDAAAKLAQKKDEQEAVERDEEDDDDDDWDDELRADNRLRARDVAMFHKYGI